MPVYEYRCDRCSHQFEATQSIHARPEDTSCPQCNGTGATRILSAFASKVRGSHKPGFEEMKAYNMLNERMDRFAKLPPAMGKRVDVTPDMMSGGGPPTSPEGNGA
jgi:putative FmdB family regulatory protein